MASTYSTNLALELIGNGDQAGSWGNTTNNNLGTLIEQAVSGYVTQAVVTGTDTTITIPNGATGVARNMYIELTGTGGASTNLVVPANKKLYFIFNNSTGAVTVKVSGQTGVSVPAAAKMSLVCNGTDVVSAVTYFAALSSASLNITGVLSLAAGTALLPSLAFTGDPNTGMWSPAADTIAFSEGGVEAMRLDSSGNLGIGTASPATRIHAERSTDGVIGTFRGTSNAQYLVGIASGVVTHDASNGSAIHTWQTNGTERARLDNLGNLGIGTSSPTRKLFVNGFSNLGGTTASVLIGDGTFAVGVASITADSGAAMQIGTAGANEMALFQNNSAIVRLLNSNMGLRTTDCGASAVGCFGIANATTVPTGAPAGGGVLYVEAGALKYRGSSGTVTTIANA
jgi:hypothetical protein